MSRFAPEFNTDAKQAWERYKSERARQERIDLSRRQEQEGKQKTQQNWQTALLASQAIGQAGQKIQQAVNKSIESNMMKQAVPQGKFVVQDGEITWAWNEGATTKDLPSLDEGWEAYKRNKKISGQIPDFREYYNLHNQMNSSYAQFMSGKLQSLSGLGYSGSDFDTAFADDNLMKNMTQAAGSTITGADGKQMPASALLTPYLKRHIGKQEGALGTARKFVGELGMPTLGAAVYGAYKAYGAGLVPGTGKVGERAGRLGAKEIMKAGLSKFKTVGKTATDATVVLKDIGSYASKHGSDDVIKLLMKKGIKKKVATKIATRAIASAAAAGIGTAGGGLTAGLSTVAGVGLAAYGLWDIWGALEEIHPDVKRQLYDTEPVGF